MRSRPLRILHVLVGIKQVGGVETWLLNVLRRIDRTRFHLTFLAHGDEPTDYEEEIRSLGAQFVRCRVLHWPTPAYSRALAAFFAAHGPFDIVHSHVAFVGGFVLRAAHRCGVPVRIAHVHTDLRYVREHASLFQRTYWRLATAWLKQYATSGFAPTRRAAESLFGTRWEEDRRWRVLPYGIDLRPFRVRPPSSESRARVDIAPDAFVVGNVGRLVRYKNHNFLLDVTEELVRIRPDAHLLLVGGGEMFAEVEQAVGRRGLRASVTMTGARSDVTAMLSAMDVFAFPSVFEGLPVAAIEAQACGLPAVLAREGISPEIDLVPGLVHWASLEDGPHHWAEAIVRAATTRNVSRDDALAALEATLVNIDRHIPALEKAYIDAVGEADHAR